MRKIAANLKVGLGVFFFLKKYEKKILFKIPFTYQTQSNQMELGPNKKKSEP